MWLAKPNSYACCNNLHNSLALQNYSVDREQSWQREKRLWDTFVAALGMETNGEEAIECKNWRRSKKAWQVNHPLLLSTQLAINRHERQNRRIQLIL